MPLFATFRRNLASMEKENNTSRNRTGPTCEADITPDPGDYENDTALVPHKNKCKLAAEDPDRDICASASDPSNRNRRGKKRGRTSGAYVIPGSSSSGINIAPETSREPLNKKRKRSAEGRAKAPDSFDRNRTGNERGEDVTPTTPVSQIQTTPETRPEPLINKRKRVAEGRDGNCIERTRCHTSETDVTTILHSPEIHTAPEASSKPYPPDEIIYDRQLHSKKRKRSDDGEHSAKNTTKGTNEDEDQRLLDIFDKRREVIIDNAVDPLLFEEHITEFKELHYKIQCCQSGGKARSTILVNEMDRMSREEKIKILRAMASSKYGRSIFADDAAKASGYKVSNELRISLNENTGIQTSSAHDDPRLASKEVRETERRMADNANKDSDINNDVVKYIEAATEKLRKGIADIKFSSIKILFSGYSEKDLHTLRAYCKSEAARLWILSTLDEESVKTMNRHAVTEAILEVYIDDTGMKFEEVDCGCLCVMNRFSLQDNVDDIKHHFDEIEMAYVDKLIESMMSEEGEELTASLEQIKNSVDFFSIKQKILEFLLRDDVPQVCFCILENMLKAKEYLHVIRNIQQRQSTDELTECLKATDSQKDIFDVPAEPYVNVLRCAFVSSFGKMLEELEPLVLQKRLCAALQLPDLDRVYHRHERVMIFVQHILKDENSKYLRHVIGAMEKHYQSVVNAVNDVLSKGSLSEHYRCPRLKGPVCVFSTKISLLDAGKTRIELKTKSSSGEEQKHGDVRDESIDMRACLEKVSSYFKEELDRTAVETVAGQLKKCNLLSDPEFQTITNKFSPRKESVDKLLKWVLGGSPEVHTEFRKAMQTTVPRLAEALTARRASATDINDVDSDRTTTAKRSSQLLEPSVEDSVVASMKTKISQQAPDQNRVDDVHVQGHSMAESGIPPKDVFESLPGFVLEEVNRESSIVLKMSPRKLNSWHNLEMKCRSGQIKDFIPKIFENISKEYLKEGEYRLKMTIYTLTHEEPDVKKALICVENECQNVKEPEHFGVLCEELDITNDLLKELKRRHIIDVGVENKLFSYKRRMERNEFLLKEIMSHGKMGIDILKENAQMTHEYLYNYMIENEQALAGNEQNTEPTNIDPETSSRQSDEPKKEIFFTSTMVLKVKRKGTATKHSSVADVEGSATADLEFSCQMINSVCMFEDKDIKESKKEDSSTENAPNSGVSVEDIAKAEVKPQTDKPTETTTKISPVAEDKSYPGLSEGHTSKTATPGKDILKGNDPETVIKYKDTERQRRPK